MKADLIHCYVLHSRPYRESSYLVDLLSLEKGRVRCVAKGAQRPKSPYRGLLQPLQPLRISLNGMGSLYNLIQVEQMRVSGMLHGDRLWAMLYANECVLRLASEEDANESLFSTYVNLLTAMQEAEPLAPAVRRFERDLLDALGHGIVCHDPATGSSLESELYYRYDFEHGPVSCDANHPLAFVGAVYNALSQGEFAEANIQRDVRKLLHGVMQNYLGAKPLQTLMQMKQMLRMENTK